MGSPSAAAAPPSRQPAQDARPGPTARQRVPVPVQSSACKPGEAAAARCMLGTVVPLCSVGAVHAGGRSSTLPSARAGAAPAHSVLGIVVPRSPQRGQAWSRRSACWGLWSSTGCIFSEGQANLELGRCLPRPLPEPYSFHSLPLAQTWEVTGREQGVWSQRFTQADSGWADTGSDRWVRRGRNEPKRGRQ